MQQLYSDCATVSSILRTVKTRVLPPAHSLLQSIRSLALFVGLLLVCTNAWGDVYKYDFTDEKQLQEWDVVKSNTKYECQIGSTTYNNINTQDGNMLCIGIISNSGTITLTSTKKYDNVSAVAFKLAATDDGKPTFSVKIKQEDGTIVSIKEGITPKSANKTKAESNRKWGEESDALSIVLSGYVIIEIKSTSSGKYATIDDIAITYGSTPSADKYTVTFNTNNIGTAPDPLPDIISGSLINEPDALTADGYTFDGWYKESSCTTPWNFSTDKVTENTTLYAKWTAKQYTFGDYIFENNLTVGTSPAKTITTTVTDYSAFDIDNISFSAMAIQYEAGTAEYGGWKIKTKNAQISFYVKSDSKVLLQSGAYGSGQQFTLTYTDATTGNNTSTIVAANTTVEVTAKADTKVTITTANSSNTATLKRLNISENGKTLYLSNQTKYQYYAVWCWGTDIKGSVKNMTIADCANYKVSVPAQCNQLIFLGSNTTFTDGSTTWPGDEKKMTGDLTIPTDGNNCFNGTDWGTYIPSLSVSFDMNGHGTAISDQCVAQGNTITKPTDPKEDGWIFSGWYTDQACTATFDFSTAITSAITLYAGWTEDLTSPIEIKGAWDNWQLRKLEKKAGETGSVAYITLNLSASTYQYGFMYNNKFYKVPAKDAQPMTRKTADGIEWQLYPDGANIDGGLTDCRLTADYTGDYTFRVDYADAGCLKVTVIYPIIYTIQYAEGRPDEITGSTSLSVNGVPADARQVLAGQSLNLPTAADIKITAGSITVYQFNGWSDGTNTYPADQTTITNISSDLTLTALWEPVAFNINYWDGQNEDNSLNTAINGLTPTTYTYASKETLPADAAAITTAAGQTGYIFKNWKVRDWSQPSTFVLKDLDYTTPYHLYGDINLYAEWEEEVGCTTIVKGTYASAGNALMTSEIGTIAIEGGNRNSKAIKLSDDDAYIQITPAIGRIFLAGDKLLVTFYSSSKKNMGFQIKDGDGNITEQRSVIQVPAGKTATDTYYLQEDDINTDGTIRIYRLSGDDRFYSIEVEQCQNVETVTATVKPGGGIIDETNALSLGWSKQVQSNNVIWYIKTVAKGSHITLPTATFDGYEFTEYQAQDADLTPYPAGQSFVLNTDQTFIAQWNPTTPTGKVKATINLNGGTFKNSDDKNLWTKEPADLESYYILINKGATLTLPELTATNKTFIGYIDQYNDTYDANTSFAISTDFDFTAQWCTSPVTLEWQGSWATGYTDHTFVLTPSATATIPQIKAVGLPADAEIKFTSSNTAVAVISDDGTTIKPFMAGETTITATFDAEGDYCPAEASYTLIVECSDATPIIVGEGNISGCNTSITLRVKQKQTDGNHTVYPSEGYTFQWYKDGTPIDGATQDTYTAQTVGDYFVVVHDFCYVQSENTAYITSSVSSPEVERLTPFQFYRPGHTYPAEQSVRHLFAYKSVSDDAKECAITAVLKRSGATNTSISDADLNTFIFISDDTDNRGRYIVTASLNAILASLGLQAGDTLTITLTPYDNCKALADAYAQSIDLRIISKPALAFIVSGADQLTRDKEKLKLHGDFLTGYNHADLHKQSARGWSDADLNDSLPLFVAIKKEFEAIPVNGYADFNRYNYEPFDILVLTDFVRTEIGKPTVFVTVIDSLAQLVDYRPMFSLKAHMAKAEFPTWKTKGFTGLPKVPSSTQKDMTVLCLAHNIFDGLPEYKDTQNAPTETDYENKIIYDAEGNIIVRVTSEGGYDSGKSLQGFEAIDATNFVNIAIISNGKSGQLITCCERQTNIYARLLILSVNADATSKLTPIGCQAVIKGLNYLLETDPVKISDCSVTFHNNNGTGDSLWTTPANWSTGRVPLKEQNIQIIEDCIVNTPEATAATIKILAGKKLTIRPRGALIANGQIWSIPSQNDKHNTSEITDPSVITILSDASGVGALVRTAGDDAALAATVQMYSKAYFEWVDGKRKKYWQYVGIPIQEAQVPECFYGAYTYLWEEANGWTRKGDGTTLEQFKGYGLSVGNKENTELTYTLRGNLATAVNRDIPLTINNANENYRGTNMIGNSWMAPIHIDKMLTTDFGTANATVYIYNTGRDEQAANQVEGNADTNQPGQWIAITPGLAAQSGYTGLKVIPAMQAFDILTTSETSLYLDYERVVRSGVTKDNINTPMRAPQGSDRQDNGITLMQLRVADATTYTDLYLMENQAFTPSFDNGWDAEYMPCDGRSAALYAITPIGQMAVSAVSDIEGTNLGFAPGKETEYTFSFGYTGKMLYLNDTRERRSTLITDWNTYLFTASDGDDVNRFYISATPIESQVPSGLVEVSDNHGLYTISNPTHENLTICLYDAAGRLCATTSTTDALTDITLPATQGIYLLRVKGENTHIVRKLTR